MNTTDILAKLDQLDDLSRAIRAAVMAEEKKPLVTIEAVYSIPSHWPVLPKGDSWHNPDELSPEKFGDECRPLTTREVWARTNPTGGVTYSSKVHRWKKRGWNRDGWIGSESDWTYRVPASWPIGHGIPNFKCDA